MSEFSLTLIPALVSALCWWAALNKSARQKMNRDANRLWRMDKEQQEMYDAMSLAAALVGALFFSFATILFLFVLFIR